MIPSVHDKLTVLFVTSEVTPLIKTGGLADVSASLPVALMHSGVDIRVLVPGYPSVIEGIKSKGRLTSFPSIGELPQCQLLAGKLPNGVPALIVDSTLFNRPGGPYHDANGKDWPDNDLRFGLLSYLGAVLSSSASPISWRPKVVHCNDWQAGLTPAYLQYIPGQKASTMMTIHNLAYQGIFPPVAVSRLGLPPSCFQPDGVEYYGNMSFLKAGLQYAGRITTVSPAYAKEIQEEELGFGMQGLLRHRSHLITGILNGIDTDAWDPEGDPYIERYFNAARLPAKMDNKRALQKRMGLAPEDEMPIIGMISRLTYQKGTDVFLSAAEELAESPAQLAILGSGDTGMQDALQDLARAHPGRIAVQIGYDEGLSHQIEAGADLFLMPSRFEPCGLNQMYSQRYGTVPIVNATGGLKDSVVDVMPETISDKTATGFFFNGVTREAVIAATKRALTTYKNKKVWRQIQKAGMVKDFSWEASAARYIELYRQLAG
ncbi:MAG: glycogen synthase GlgA [Burkholderiales bacterium]